MVMSDEQWEKLYDSVLEMKDDVTGLRHDLHWVKGNAEIQGGWCKRNEDRIVELEKWSSRSKGYFKIISRALSVIAASVIAVSAFLYQSLRGT